MPKLEFAAFIFIPNCASACHTVLEENIIPGKVERGIYSEGSGSGTPSPVFSSVVSGFPCPPVTLSTG